MTAEARALLILIDVQRDLLRARGDTKPGMTNERALRRLDEAAGLLKPDGEPT